MGSLKKPPSKIKGDSKDYPKQAFIKVLRSEYVCTCISCCLLHVYRCVYHIPSILLLFVFLLLPLPAVFYLSASGSAVEQQEFYLQLDRWMRISGENHPFLMGMLGCTTHSEQVSLLMKFAENGDLHSYLLDKRKKVCCYTRTNTYTCTVHVCLHA